MSRCRHPPLYEYHLVGVQESVWCDHCRLPSAFTVRLVLVSRYDPTRWLGRTEMTTCRECGATAGG